MVWQGGNGYSLAPAIAELFAQLQREWPSQGWQNSPQTGTIGDLAHIAEGAASDHNPWLANTVRALDVSNQDTAGPDCEAIFQMVNQMYAAKDPRVWPNGYAIYKSRITDWDNPGGYHAQQGDPHLLHVHVSVSQDPAGYNSTQPWPLGEHTTTETAKPLEPEEDVPYIARDGSNRYWVIRLDFSSRTEVTRTVAMNLQKTGKYAGNPGLDQTTLAHIPVAK